jgi:uncharacterized membrane protein
VSRRINKHAATYLIIVLLGLLILGIGAWLRPTLSQNVQEWDLSRQPEPLTELYFTEHKSLPKKYAPAEATSLSFTVNNLESKAVTYRYEVVQYNAESTAQSVLKTGSFNLSNNTSHTESVLIAYVDAGTRSRVTVHLVDQNQAIHYWVER